VYNRVIGDLVRLDLQREEIKVRQQEQKLLEMQVQKLGKELNEGKVQELQSEDLKLLQSAISQLSRADSEPKYPTVFDINQPK
jgi:dihydroxyacid dehydratase/phosphogluconate dehydratase